MNLRREAKGRECLIRIPGHCNGNPETVVGCHFRLASLCGVGMKPDDRFMAWGCSACHDAIDGRVRSAYSRDELKLMHAEGVFRTQAVLIEEGKL